MICAAVEDQDKDSLKVIEAEAKQNEASFKEFFDTICSILAYANKIEYEFVFNEIFLSILNSGLVDKQNLDGVTSCRSILRKALEFGDLALVKKVEQQLNIKADHDDNLNYAVRSSTQLVSEYLVKTYGLKPTLDHLHVAISYGNFDATQYLIEECKLIPTLDTLKTSVTPGVLDQVSEKDPKDLRIFQYLVTQKHVEVPPGIILNLNDNRFDIWYRKYRAQQQKSFDLKEHAETESQNKPSYSKF